MYIINSVVLTKIFITKVGDVPDIKSGDSQSLPTTSTHQKCTDPEDKSTVAVQSDTELDDSFSSVDLNLIN